MNTHVDKQQEERLPPSPTIYDILAFGGGFWRLLSWAARISMGLANRGVQRGISFDVSPLGDQIVFTGAGTGIRDLYLLDSGTLQVTRIARTPEYESDPAFSPDGRSVVYSASAALPGPAHLFVRSLEGGSPVQLTPNEPFYDSMPAFSPDGSQIVFVRAHRLRPYSLGGYTWDDEDVYVMNADGTDLRRITRGKYYQLSRPQLARDGKTGVFCADRSMRFDLFRVPVSGDQPPQPLTTDGHSSDPALSRDGSQIVFVSDRAKAYDYDLYLMDLDGSNLKRLTDNRAHNEHPVITADGQRVLFLSGTRHRAGMRYSLWEVETDSLHLRQIADPHLFDAPLSRLR
jgi:TolB protein